MRLSDFDYNLPKDLIAQQPVKPRNHSRLLVFRRGTTNSAHANTNRKRETGKIKHKHFYDLPDYLQKNDVLVLNNSKVFPARLIGKKVMTGGKIEVFLLRKIPPTPNPSPARSSRERGTKGIWKCLLGGHGRKEGLEIEFRRGLKCAVAKDNNDGTWEVKFNKGGGEFMEIVERIGQTPLPPYIKRPTFATPSAKAMEVKKATVGKADSKNYQTVYADEKKIGSVAAPTAGFHFTPRLMKKLKDRGVQFEYITLHVGLGTFAPMKTDDITKHKMHAEWVEVKKSVLERIVRAKSEERRIIAVGTTSVRTLEAIWNQESGSRRNQESGIGNQESGSRNHGFKGWVDIFIYPGYKFKVVDAMITNFHLPKSTLLMLASAFTGKRNIDKIYRCAIKNKYRFYSYGDAMLII